MGFRLVPKSATMDSVITGDERCLYGSWTFCYSSPNVGACWADSSQKYQPM